MSEITVLINNNTEPEMASVFLLLESSKLGQEKQKVASSCKKCQKKKKTHNTDALN